MPTLDPVAIGPTLDPAAVRYAKWNAKQNPNIPPAMKSWIQQICQMEEESGFGPGAKRNRGGTKLKTSEMKRFVRMSYDQQMRSKNGDKLCPLLIGLPGIGKTMCIEELAKEKGVKVFTIILSQANPSEVAGMVMPSNEEKATDIWDPKWVNSIEDGDIIFWDEMLKAPLPVLNSTLTMVQERRMASNTQLPNVAMFGASNWDRSYKQFPLEIRQRFHKVDVEWDSWDWRAYVGATYKWNVSDYMIKYMENVLADEERSPTDGSRWNRLTPREMTKMLIWMDQTKKKDDRTFLSDYLASAYEHRVVTEMMKAVGWNKKKSKQDILHDAVWLWMSKHPSSTKVVRHTRLYGLQVIDSNINADIIYISNPNNGPRTICLKHLQPDGSSYRTDTIEFENHSETELMKAMAECGLVDTMKDFLANVDFNYIEGMDIDYDNPHALTEEDVVFKLYNATQSTDKAPF